MQFTVSDKVDYKGKAYTITRLVGDTAKIVIVRRARGWPGFAEVNTSILKPWAPISKVSAHAMTCQICGRPIHAAAGVIAHHGYERPGDGQQTESCYGARYAPFEVSRDRLGGYLKLLPVLIERCKLNIANFEARTVYVGRWEDEKDERGRGLYRGGKPVKVWVDYAPGAPKYPVLAAAAIQAQRNRIADYLLQIEEQTKRFNSWSPKP